MSSFTSLPRAITVFTGSASGSSKRYQESATEFAAALASAQIEIIYGGGHVGLMGVIADAALRAGGRVTGVMPQILVDGETAHTGLTRLEVVADMRERKTRMAELGEAFVALPGGVGTLEELFEVWTWQHLGVHQKPVFLYDVDGFWQPLLTALDHMVTEGFLAQAYRESLVVVENTAHLFDELGRWQAPTPKWSR